MSNTPRTHHGRIIDTSIHIDATPMRAWQAWADPEHIANWFVDRAEGTAAPGQVMTWFFDTFNYRQPVPVIEAEPGRSFVIGSADAPGPHGVPYLMEITIAADSGRTVVNLVNSGFSEDSRFDDEFEGVASGWKCALATMKEWLERYPDRRRAHRLSLQPARYTFDTLRPWFHTTDGRRQWFGPVLPVDGPVLEDTGREVMLAWREREAVVGVKAFSMGPQQMLALDLSTWTERPLDLDGVAGELSESLVRLATALEN